MGDMADLHADSLYDDDEFFYGEDFENEFDCTVVSETPKAWYLEFKKGKREWLPKSQCTLKGDGKSILIPEWLARKKGL